MTPPVRRCPRTSSPGSRRRARTRAPALSADATSPPSSNVAADRAPLAQSATCADADREEATAERRDARAAKRTSPEAAALARRRGGRYRGDHDRGPHAPNPTRRPAPRRAPAFACCDFADHLDAASSGPSRALEAPVLLDAWSPRWLAARWARCFAVPRCRANWPRPVRGGPRAGAGKRPGHGRGEGILDRLALDSPCDDGIATTVFPPRFSPAAMPSARGVIVRRLAPSVAGAS